MMNGFMTVFIFNPHEMERIKRSINGVDEDDICINIRLFLILF